MITEEQKQALYDKLDEYLADANIMGYARIEPIKVIGDANNIADNLTNFTPFIKDGNKFILNDNYFNPYASGYIEPAY
jgi:hypothetical protein